MIPYLVMNSQLSSFIKNCDGVWCPLSEFHFIFHMIANHFRSLSLVFFLMSLNSKHTISQCACMNCQNPSSKRKTNLFHIVNTLINTVVTIMRSYGGFVKVYGSGTRCKMKMGKWFHRINGYIQLNIKCWTTTSEPKF